MDDIQRERAADTHIECPKCLAAGIVSASGYATRIICMPDLEPPFRCLAVHGGVTRDDLVSAGIDPRLLLRWSEIARGGTPSDRRAVARPDSGADRLVVHAR